MEYKVVTKENHLEVWAMGFYGDYGRNKAKEMIVNGYWHRYMYERDKHKTLVVVPVTSKKQE